MSTTLYLEVPGAIIQKCYQRATDNALSSVVEQEVYAGRGFLCFCSQKAYVAYTISVHKEGGLLVGLQFGKSSSSEYFTDFQDIYQTFGLDPQKFRYIPTKLLEEITKESHA